jgi:cytoskeletal protein RodZ
MCQKDEKRHWKGQKMSVEKVNKYKEEKAKRKETLAKEKKARKRNKAIITLVAAIVVLAIVGAIGLTIRNQYVVYLNTRPNYDTTSMLVSDLAGVQGLDTEEAEASVEDETEAPAEEESESEAETETESVAETEAESTEAQNE